METPEEEATVATVNVGLFVRLEAAQGREDDLADFLRKGQALVEEEPATVAIEQVDVLASK